MFHGLRPIPLFFWRSLSGREPVREWLAELPQQDRHVVGSNLGTVQFGWPVGMPLCRSLGEGLWELRSSMPSRREARVIFGFHDDSLIILHGFIKKTQKTSDEDLSLAKQRWKDVSR
jgi:phage-related protein